VTEMADARDLDAIFKPPRNENEVAIDAVTPFATPAHGDGPTPSSSSSQSRLQFSGFEPQSSLFRTAREEEAASSSSAAAAAENGAAVDDEERRRRGRLANPYPVESQWSIPSIRHANRVDPTSSSGAGVGRDPDADGFADRSEYTDDDESFYSFLEDDDDDASLGSRGSLDATGARRRRMISGIFQLQRKDEEEGAAAPSSGAARTAPSFDGSDDAREAVAAAAVPTKEAGPSIVPPSPEIAPSDWFARKVQGISIVGAVDSADGAVVLARPPSLSRRANTFDSEAPPPILDIDAAATPSATADDAADHYSRPRWHHRGGFGGRHRGGGRGSRRRRKEGAAVEWLRELQHRSQGVSSSESGGEYLIAEAASSKFLSAGGTDGDGGGGGRSTNASSSMATAEEEGVAKGLGMPHPLCRSSTIEAGPFVNRAKGAFGSRNTDVGGVTLGSNNSIALTSSGSGD